jgi:hypothetical protein
MFFIENEAVVTDLKSALSSPTLTPRRLATH